MEKVFYKEEGRWFIFLPEYEGPKEDLEMVAGADVFLDTLSEGSSSVRLYLTLNPYKGAEVLTMLDDDGTIESGAFYRLDSYKTIKLELIMWLCDVTKFVFLGEFPERIYFNKIEL